MRMKKTHCRVRDNRRTTLRTAAMLQIALRMSDVMTRQYLSESLDLSIQLYRVYILHNTLP